MSTAVATRSPGLVERFASRYSVEPAKLLTTLKATAFKQSSGAAPTNEQMMALLVVADQHGLNPFTREIYAFPDKQSGIVPIVGVDGWNRICNEHPQYDGVEFRYSEEMVQIDEHHRPAPEWCEAVIYRKDRSRPIIAREWLDEVYRPPFQRQGSSYIVKGPWQTHTKRFLRHKALIQCARIAFGFAGIYDEDEADHVIANLRAGSDGTYTPEVMEAEPPRGAASKLDSLAGEPQGHDAEPPAEEVQDAEIEEEGEAEEELRYLMEEDGSVLDTETGEIVPKKWVRRYRNGQFVVAPAYEQSIAASEPAGNGAAPAEADGALFGAEG